jgi:hypothetical protein
MFNFHGLGRGWPMAIETRKRCSCDQRDVKWMDFKVLVEGVFDGVPLRRGSAGT